MIAFEEALCTGCGDCIAACPEKAITLSEGRAVINQALCGECGACIQSCPTGALFKAEIIPTVNSRQVAPSTGKYSTLTTAGAILVLIGREILPIALPHLVRAIEKRGDSRQDRQAASRDSMRITSGKTCICRECGVAYAHTTGIPCRIRRCPRCGGSLVRQ